MKNTIFSLSIMIVLCLICHSRLNAQIITTFAGGGTYYGDGGQATAAHINNPYDIVFDGSGNSYIADKANNRIRKVDITGIISTYAGTGSGGFSGDGGQATAAEIYAPAGLAIDGAGNLYIADAQTNCIRKVNSSGVISTIAGTPPTYNYWHSSYNDQPATNAGLNGPHGLALDATGNLYIAGYGQNNVTKVNTSGNIHLFAGTGADGYSGDGGVATSAKMHLPTSVNLDASGNVYITTTTAPYGDRIRKVDGSGNISTYIGSGITGYSGDGGLATANSVEINHPMKTVFDNSGNLYIADMGNNRIRKVNAGGYLSTFAGNGTSSFCGDGGPATGACFINPWSITFDVKGNLYIADMLNNRIRKVINKEPYFNNGSSYSLSSICVNSSAVDISSYLAIKDTDGWSNIAETWSIISAPSHGSLGGFPKVDTNKGSTLTPSGLTYTPTTDYYGSDAFSIQISDGYLTDTITINVTVVSPGTISGATAICAGSSISLFSSGTTGGTWSSSNTSYATVNSSGVVSGVAAGTVTITYVVLSGCNATYTITVNALPIISGNSPVCNGATVTLSGSTGGDTWSSSNTGVATVASSVVTGVSVGNANITYYSSTTSCSVSVITTVNPLPTANTITGTQIICAGFSTSLSNTITPGTWNSSNASIATVDGSGNVTGVYAGIVNITYTIACGTSTTTISVNPTISPLNPSANSYNVCAGYNLVLSSTQTGGDYGTSYSWVGPNSFSSTLASPNIFAMTECSGVYTLTATPVGCTTSITNTTLTITVNAPFSNICATAIPNVLCNDNTTAITLDGSITGGTDLSYSWSGPSGVLGTTVEVITGTYTATGIYIYTLTVTAGVCPAATATALVIVKPCSEARYGNSSNSGTQYNNNINYTLSPNPSTGTISIVQSVVVDEMVAVKVINSIGQLFYNGDLVFTSGKSQLSIANATPGIYLIEFVDNKGYKEIFNVVIEQ